MVVQNLERNVVQPYHAPTRDALRRIIIGRLEDFYKSHVHVSCDWKSIVDIEAR